ncbi:hypothetical protein Pelo_7889 [Pelomyxa schiedti]|nr:hypothetical protein Pelo_7889 [Pelomyxa schiedti]
MKWGFVSPRGLGYTQSRADCIIIILATLLLSVSQAHLPSSATASGRAPAAAGTSCTYVGYGGFFDSNQRTFQTALVGQDILVEVHAYSLGFLHFTEHADGASLCDFSLSNPNGWTVAQLKTSTDPCAQNVTKTFDAAEYEAHCGSLSTTETGESLRTTAEDVSVNLWYNKLPNGDDYYVNASAVFQTTLLLQTSVNSSLIAYTVTPLACGAVVYGTSGVYGENIFANIMAQVTAPYFITAIESIPIAIPSTQYAATVLTTGIDHVEHGYSSAFGLLTSIPRQDCYCYGNFTVKFYLSCSPYDASCDTAVLAANPFFLTNILVAVPSCAMQYQSSSAALTIITYNEDDEVDLSFMSGDRIKVSEQISVENGLTPAGNCECSTTLMVYDWAGILQSNFSDVQNDRRFSPVTVSVEPLLNEFWITLDSDLFNSPNGNVISLFGKCVINWDDEEEAEAHGTQNLRADSEIPASTQGYMSLSVAPTGDVDLSWVIALCACGGAAAVVAFAVLAFVIYKRRHKVPQVIVDVPSQKPHHEESVSTICSSTTPPPAPTTTVTIAKANFALPRVPTNGTHVNYGTNS